MANPEHVELVRQGAKSVNKFTAANPEVTIDLSGADLSGLDLSNCRLQGANLEGADLSRCDLRNTRLNSANLRSAVLRDADARSAGLHRADLSGADLRGARFDAIGVGGQRVCISPHSFQDARWDREQIEEVLRYINLNSDWEVRYEIAPKSRMPTPARRRRTPGKSGSER